MDDVAHSQALAGFPIYVGFSVSTGLFNAPLGWLIRKITGGKCNHSFLLYRTPNLGWVTLSATMGGVDFSALADFTRTRTIVELYGSSRIDLWKGLEKLRDDIGAKYNITGLIGMTVVEIARRWFHDRYPRNVLSQQGDLFCSQFCTDVIRESGDLILPGLSSNAIDPELLRLTLSRDSYFQLACTLPGDGGSNV